MNFLWIADIAKPRHRVIIVLFSSRHRSIMASESNTKTEQDTNSNDTSQSEHNNVNDEPEAYMVTEAKLNQSKLEQFAIYAAKSSTIVRKYGGQYIVLGGEHTPLEGEWDTTRIVLHKWPNAATAKLFWYSNEYQELKKLRDGTGEFRIMLLEGLDRSDYTDKGLQLLSNAAANGTKDLDHEIKNKKKGKTEMCSMNSNSGRIGSMDES